MSKRKPIDFYSTTKDALTLMMEDSAGALSVLEKISTKYPDELIIIMRHLDDMNIRGKQIWVGYSYCDENIDKFIKAISKRDRDMINKINQECLENKHKAVFGGALGMIGKFSI